MLNSILFVSIFGIINSLDKYSTNGEICISIERKHIHQLECPANKNLFIKQAWYDGQKRCHFRISSTSLLFNEKIKNCTGVPTCTVSFYSLWKKYSYFNILFQCKGFHNTSVEENEPESDRHIIPIDGTKKQVHDRNIIPIDGTTTQVNDPNIVPIDESTTQFYGFENTSDEESKPDSHDGPDYALVIGVIVGVLLITCIIVGVCLLRRRNASSIAKMPIIMTSMTQSYSTHDPAHGQTEPDNVQQAHLMNSSDTIHLSLSQAVVTNEVSITYLHLSNTVDDSDVMYDHTVRHTVRNTGDGDYGIAHKILTEDDYDVSGNDRLSLTNKTYPVYN